MNIASLFAKPIDRPIEGVIKADDDSGLRTEFEEYILTDEVARQLTDFFNAYNSYAGANGAWISGFFGSGKSHLLKTLAFLLENRAVDGRPALQLFEPKTAGKDDLLLADMRRAAAIPSRSILFNIDQKADLISKQEVDALLAVFVKVFDEMAGYYGKQGYIAQFERDLDRRGQLDAFRAAYQAVAGRPWTTGREQALLEGPNIAQAYTQATGAPPGTAAGILDKYRAEYKMSIDDFAAQVHDYVTAQGPDFRLNFFVDEVGQYVADNVKLMTNLQTIAESLAVRSRGRAWLVVTAQEEMGQVLGEMTKRQSSDFSKIQDRFKLRLKLTSTNAAEVIRQRLLAKRADVLEPLSDLYNDQQNNLKTLFTFADGTKSYRVYRDREEFIHTYPFVPYQFDLFQAAIRGLSDHGAFEGRHSSVGERSMLGVFQQVAIAIGRQDVGHLATFDQMFDGIRATLKSQIQASILNAERTLDDPFAVRLLKALFLVKYVDEFKATARNLAVLMVAGFDEDLAALRSRVEAALEVLARQVFVARSGEEYEYLTDEEKDIEQEIRNTPVENSEVPKLWEDVIFERILKESKIRLPGSDQDYPFARKIDDQLFGRSSELAIHVITPYHEHNSNVAILRSQSMGRDELLVVVPPDERLTGDLSLYLRTIRYIQHHTIDGQKESVVRILNAKRDQNVARKEAIVRRAEGQLAAAQLIINGSDVDPGTGNARSRLLGGFGQLVERTYPHRAMLRGVKYNEADVDRYLQPQTTLLGGAEATFSEAELEILNFINTTQATGRRTTMRALVARFERKPYGWPLAAVQCITAKLLARGKIEARRDSNVLEGAELAAALRNGRGFDNVLLDPLGDFDERQIRALRQFHSAFFDGPPHANEAKALGQETAAAFTVADQELARLQGDTADYPFGPAVAQAATRVAAAAHQPYPFYLNELPAQADALLDLKEQVIDPLRRFWNGPQRAIYDDADRLLSDQRANLPHLADNEAGALRALLDAPDVYAGPALPRIKNMADRLRAQSEALLAAERRTAAAAIDAARERLAAEPDFAALSPAQQAELLRRVEPALAAIDAHNLVDAIRGTRYNFERETLPAIRQQAWQWANPAPPPAPGDADQPPPPAPPLSLAALVVPFDGPIASADDAERYLAALRGAIMRALEEGKRLRLP